MGNQEAERLLNEARAGWTMCATMGQSLFVFPIALGKFGGLFTYTAGKFLPCFENQSPFGPSVLQSGSVLQTFKNLTAIKF
jgi:hypothetical protein